MIISYAETPSVPPWVKAVIFISDQNRPHLYSIWMGPVCSKTDGEKIGGWFCLQSSRLTLRKNRH